MLAVAVAKAAHADNTTATMATLANKTAPCSTAISADDELVEGIDGLTLQGKKETSSARLRLA
jgi:hypothetical protein